MEVQAALDQLMVQNNITVIVIAHRLATIRKVDRIFYMSNDGLEGTVIAEEGSFDQLIAKGGLFAVMARSQGAAPSSEEGPTLRDAPATQQEENEDDYPNQILSEEEIAKLEEEVPRTERQSVPIEELAEWEMQRTQVGPLRLLKLNKRYVWALLLALLGSLIAGAVAPVNTILLGKLLMSCANYESVKFFFPDVAEDDLKSDMKLYAPLFIVIAFACFVGWVLQFFYGFAGEHLTTKIRIMLFGQILRQDMSFFDTPSRDAGTLSGMLSGDCEAIHQLCGQSIGLKIQTVCTILIGIIIGLVYQWKLGLIAMACLPLIVFAVLFEQMLMSGLNDGKKAMAMTRW
ncbi:hypothetical protein AGDE_15428 [Angomonas deanei]|uniref:ABC transporter transmembrane region containing protein, putative n=1 Tax=Angomonas deanei TaxID=59799 RepID=A0A7G2CR72_9TRYP|nr:hypothetical protein AGDE_15428 [Angomonas deanei]CAD2221879.1 ABC transporter transmembrane region containing protein, putative [Angomonas deanei]|eukprot:EPY19112.1 hypothetical protein AGDE_15428 [Angomonas deanei]